MKSKSSMWSKLIPSRYYDELEEAKQQVTEQRSALEETRQRDTTVNTLVRFFKDDLRRNHYGPTIARALGRKV